jgi:hypothetical protein
MKLDNNQVLRNAISFPDGLLEGVEFNIADIFDNGKSRIHSKTDLKMIRKGWSRKFMLLVLCFVCSREV